MHTCKTCGTYSLSNSAACYTCARRSPGTQLLDECLAAWRQQDAIEAAVEDAIDTIPLYTMADVEEERMDAYNMGLDDGRNDCPECARQAREAARADLLP